MLVLTIAVSMFAMYGAIYALVCVADRRAVERQQRQNLAHPYGGLILSLGKIVFLER